MRLLLLILLALQSVTLADTARMAILGFSGDKHYSQDDLDILNEVLIASLSSTNSVQLIDRQEINKTLEETQISMSGLSDQTSALKVGKLVSAELIVIGKVFQIRNKKMFFAKIISVETSKMTSVKVSGTEDLDIMSFELGEQVVNKIETSLSDLLPDSTPVKSYDEQIKILMKDKKIDSAYVKILEEHVRSKVIDPAAETEVSKLYQSAGGKLYADKDKARYHIVGEAFSEFSGMIKNLVSCEARVEIKVIDTQDGSIVAIDREMVTKVGLNEMVTGKKALQDAAAKIALRVIPKLSE